MLRTKILAERQSFFQDGVEKGIEQGIEQGMMLEKHGVLIDLMAIKFGASEKAERKVKSAKNADKLDKALRKILTSESREDVLKCLD